MSPNQWIFEIMLKSAKCVADSYCMQITEILTQTLANGGGTFADTKRIPTTGYIVGIDGETVATPQPASAFYANQCVAACEAIERIRSRVRLWEYLGTWVDGETLFVDRVMILPTLELAMRLASKHGQVAIYNLSTNETIEV